MILSPDTPFELFIAFCWFVFMIVWAVSAFFVKRTVERSWGGTRWLVILLGLMLFGTLLRFGGMWPPLWARTARTGALGALVTAAGLAVAVWARFILGRNWSGTITFKEDHELITRGPYAYVRHPIYSGLLLMMLGTAIESARLRTFLLLALVLVVLRIKAHFEEKLMIRHFPEAYPEYRRRVKALIPGVW
jgi:protein-S-isoprenylcysteine O-methyltransferase Ste14